MPAHFALLFTVLLGAAGSYVQRPSFKKPFPDPALFHKSGRRLAPEGDKPERLHFDVEDRGYRFRYDFGGTSTVERVFDLDVEGVEGIECMPGQDGFDRISILWSNQTVAHAANLQQHVAIGLHFWVLDGSCVLTVVWSNLVRHVDARVKRFF